MENDAKNGVLVNTTGVVSPAELLRTNTTRYRRKRLAQLFVRDLLKARKYTDEHTAETDYYFEIFGLIFTSVYLRGTVVSLDRFGTKHMSLVDDGSAAIPCVFSRQALLDEKREDVQSMLDEITKTNCKDDVALQAALALLYSSRDHLKNCPRPDEFKLGDVIHVTGNLGACKDQHHIFVDTYRLDRSNDVQHDISYYDDLLDIYERNKFFKL